MNKKNGFTLVELSIVMIIIGLLIGGVLKGQQLINNSRIARTIGDLKSFQSGINIFLDTYGNLPGDIPSATTLVPNCTTANNCVGGNGNNKIGVEELVPWHYRENKAIDSETLQFWKHMALADIIGGIDPGSSAMEWGKALPSGPLGGGYTIADVRGVTVGLDSADFQGTIIRVHDCPVNCAQIESAPATVLTSNNAASIDRKMDDGQPLTGSIRASGAGGNQNDPCTAKNGTDGVYNENDNVDGACVLYFKIK